MTALTRRTAGWMGIIFVVLLFLSAGLVTLPSSTQSEEGVATFYATNRTIILITQAIGLLAAPVFVAFTLGLQNSISDVDVSKHLNAIGITGILVALVSVATALPVIALSLTTADLAFWVRMTDASDAVLFLAITLFCAAGLVLGHEAPVWWRGIAALTGLVAFARSVTGFAGMTTALDILAPLAFIAFVLASAIYLLLGASHKRSSVTA